MNTILSTEKSFDRGRLRAVRLGNFRPIVEITSVVYLIYERVPLFNKSNELLEETVIILQEPFDIESP
jgi:hypothetical protein